MLNAIASLSGAWLLYRQIDDGSLMAGTARFIPRGIGRFDYLEQGQLRLVDGRTLGTERGYIFEETESGFAVFFTQSPPRLFHRVTLEANGRNLVGVATHLCAGDRYDSHYEFRANASFTIEHRVCGPHKRYTSVTHYVRASL
jgi:hypothetical protein